MASHRAPALSILAALTGVALLSGCASAAGDDNATAQTTAASAEYPLTIDNCGFDLTVAAAPQKIITIKSTATEMLLALGLGDRIIGEAFQDGPVPENWSSEAAKIPVLSEQVPGSEAVLAAEPDFVYAGWESNLTAESAGDRAALAALGVGSYVSPAACKAPGYKPAKLGFDELFDEITEAGAIFGAEKTASALVTEQKTQLSAIEPSTAALTALWYSSGTDVPYVGAGNGAPQMMLDALGLSNIAADVNDTWASYNWESVVAANPDVIVLVDATWNTAASKIDRLEQNPATAKLDAVVNKRYLTVPFAGGEAGVRSVPATADLATQLAALKLG